MVKKLDKKRFDALVFQSRSPGAAYISRELSWWTTSNESLIGVVIQDTIDDDFLGIVLGRDETGQFRAIDISQAVVSPSDAENWLRAAMKWHARDGKRVFEQGDTGKAIDFFAPIVDDAKLHPYFAILRDSDSHLPAREMLNLIAPHFHDIDGNFLQQFQTTGFDARLWELYLQAYFVEEELFLNRDHNAPDFIVEKFGLKVGIEATIVGRKSDNPARYFRLDVS